MHPDSMPRNSIRDAEDYEDYEDYEASYMMSNATLQRAIDRTHSMLQSTSSSDAQYLRLQTHFAALLQVQENRAGAVRRTLPDG